MILNNIKGFRPWERIPTSVIAVEKNKPTGTGATEWFQMSFGVVPKVILPASKFLVASFSDNCSIPVPWAPNVFPDTIALIGDNPTLAGAMGSIAAAQIALASPNPVILRLSIDSASGNGPVYGYCVGDTFSERSYFTVIAYNNDGFTLLQNAYQSVHQKYAVRRFLLKHGQIDTYYKDPDPLVTDEYVSIGIGSIPKSLTGTTCSLTCYRKDGKTYTLSVKGFLENGDAIIPQVSTADSAPSSGDFFVINKPLFLEDPFLLGGIWSGTESDWSTSVPRTSGFDLPVTMNQKLWTSGKFIGGYALFDIGKDDAGNAKNQVVASGVGQPMVDSESFEWRWWLRSKDDKASQCYYESPEDRMTIGWAKKDGATNVVTPPAGGVGPPQNKNDIYSLYVETAYIMPTCTKADVTYGIDQKQTDHVRLEIDNGGSFSRNNFHSPILKNEYVQQGGKYFKILAQVNASAIDVAYTSVDGSTKLDIEGEFDILSQYAWKIISHDSAARYGHGTITSVSPDATNNTNTVELTMPKIGMHPETFEQVSHRNYASYDYLNPNSFHQRFTTTYNNSKSQTKDLYVKGNKWILKADSGTREYSVKLLDSMDSSGFVFKLILDGTADDLKTGDRCYLLFDVQQSHVGNPGGSLGNFNDGGGKVCLTGTMYSPLVKEPLSTYEVVGICDAFLWWFGNSFPVGMGSVIYMTTPYGFLSTSAYESSVPSLEGVLFSDVTTDKVSIRKGSMEFQEYPVKEEVAIGLYSKKSAITAGAKYDLDQTEDRLNAINIKMSTATNADDFLTFGVGSENDYYGTPVSGGGNVNLAAINEAKIDVGQTDIKNDGIMVSPVYVYMPGNHILCERKFVPIGVNTDVGTIYFNKSIKTTSAGSVLEGSALYVNEAQTINALGGFDIFVMPDGEEIILYSRTILDKLDIDGLKNNDKDNDTEWVFSNSCIMAIGRAGHVWATPIKKKAEDASGIYSIPVMLANCCEYLCAICSGISGKLLIFAQCYNDNGVPFIGCFKIDRSLLYYDESPKASTVDTKLSFGKPQSSPSSETSVKPSDYKDAEMPFWVRPFKMGADVNDAEKTYTSTHNLLKLNAKTDADKTDAFVRVYGPTDTKSNVTGDNWGIVSCRELGDGNLVLFIDEPPGASMLFSDSSYSWFKSEIILAKGGTCGFMIDDDKFYYLIPGVGIAEKEINRSVLSDCMDLSRRKKRGQTTSGGVNIDTAISELQKQIDEMKSTIIGSGALDSQRFSGFINRQGVRKIFFYTPEGYLSCLKSTGINWATEDNF